MDEILFTPASLLDLLSQIDELKDVDVGITETDGQIQLHVGDSVYNIKTNETVEVQVEEEDLNAIDDANDQTYQELSASGDVVLEEPVESGLLKQLVKTLLVGGLVRLTSKALK